MIEDMMPTPCACCDGITDFRNMTDDLLEEIRDYYHNHGRYPKVKVNEELAYSDKYYVDLCKLQFNDNVEIEIDETVDQWELE